MVDDATLPSEEILPVNVIRLLPSPEDLQRFKMTQIHKKDDSAPAVIGSKQEDYTQLLDDLWI